MGWKLLSVLSCECIHLYCVSLQVNSARVLAFEPQHGILAVSKSSDIALSAGHGVLKVSSC